MAQTYLWNIPPTEADLAWVAGFFDGEGSVGVYKRNTNKSGGKRGRGLFVSIVQSNEEPFMWLKEIFGGSYNVRKVTSKSVVKQTMKCYQWNVTCRSGLAFLKSIQPFVKIKKSQVDLAIQFQETKGRAGLNLTPERTAYEADVEDRLRLLKKVG